MKLKFLGACREVGHSGVLLKSSGANVLMDYGSKVKNEETNPVAPGKINALVVSHSHLDHCGMVPMLYKWQKPPIYATELTHRTSHILQYDSVKIVELRNKMNGEKRQFYTDEDVDSMGRSEVPVDYKKAHNIGNGISIELSDAGHIPGSSSILLESEGKRVLYTGDINLGKTYLTGGADIPKADVLITESTYGNVEHPNRKETEKHFLEAVRNTVDRGGVALVPAFAVGRSQEVLMMLSGMDDVYLDGMGKRVTELYLKYPEFMRDSDALSSAVENARFVQHNRERDKIIKKPCIIVTTAGMLHGGPVVYYIRKLRKDTSSSIILTGFQVEGTNGRLLAEQGHIVDRMDNTRIDVDMEVWKFNFSAHGDEKDLKEIVRRANPDKIFVVHGDPENCVPFAQSIGAALPREGEEFEI
ncbi:MAG: hypothetical protein MSIBF_03170 [Candidatus Altiarchaeales archaeon IMC4]|nr:MAG: hypothetical protein MSIBF_03170 [Candidatus Altiarchaeales archaeon IMC4]